jgi:hypothetical protein
MICVNGVIDWRFIRNHAFSSEKNSEVMSETSSVHADDELVKVVNTVNRRVQMIAPQEVDLFLKKHTLFRLFVKEEPPEEKRKSKKPGKKLSKPMKEEKKEGARYSFF